MLIPLLLLLVQATAAAMDSASSLIAPTPFACVLLVGLAQHVVKLAHFVPTIALVTVNVSRASVTAKKDSKGQIAR